MKRANILRYAATFVLFLTGIFWLFKGIADILGGIQGGTNNLITAVALIFLALFGWKRPLLGGIMIALLGVILAVYFNFSLPDIYSAYIPLLLICAPMTLGGLLFIEADWNSKKRD
jgi:hypothetical protein